MRKLFIQMVRIVRVGRDAGASPSGRSSALCLSVMALLLIPSFTEVRASADLTITGQFSVTPTTVVPGQSVQLSSWTVVNQGNSSSGSFKTGFYLSTDSVITPSDHLLAEMTNDSLAAGALSSQGQSTLTIPEQIAPGPYYVGILVDRAQQIGEANENNNSVSTPLQVRQAIPELLSPEEGAVLDNGCPDKSNLLIWDFDWSDVDGATQYYLYVTHEGSTYPVINQAVNQSEFELRDNSYIIDVNRFDWIWKVRALVAGVWGPWTEWRSFSAERLGADCTDYGSDLTIQIRLSVAPTQVEPGGTVRLSSWSVTNQGTSTTGSFSNGFYLSNDAEITANDTYLNGTSNGQLGPGQTLSFGPAYVKIPAETEPGDYFIGILADQLGSVNESDEGNNYVSARLVVNNGNASEISRLYFPQFADMAGFTSTFIVFSTSTGSPVDGTLLFYDQSGRPRSTAIGDATTTEREVSVAASGSMFLKTRQIGNADPGWAVFESSEPVEGMVTFEYRSGGRLDTAVGIAGSRPAARWTVPVESPSQVGIAIVNSGDGPVDVRVKLFDANGSMVRNLSPAELQNLQPRVQTARFLSEIGAPVGFQGTAVLEATGGTIALAGLLVKEGLLSTLPVIETP